MLLLTSRLLVQTKCLSGVQLALVVLTNTSAWLKGCCGLKSTSTSVIHIWWPTSNSVCRPTELQLVSNCFSVCLATLSAHRGSVSKPTKMVLLA